MNKKLPIRRHKPSIEPIVGDNPINRVVFSTGGAVPALEKTKVTVVELDISSDDDEVDEEAVSDEELDAEKCLVCGLSLKTLTDTGEKEEHVRVCVLRGSVKSTQGSETGRVVASRSSSSSSVAAGTINSKSDDVSLQFGLLERKFYCVVCDLDMSRRCLLSRCRHLKRCAKIHSMTTRQLLMRVGTEGDEEEDDASADPNDCVGIGIAEAGGILNTVQEPVLKAKPYSGEVIVLGDSAEEEEGGVATDGGGFIGHPQQQGPSTSPTAASFTDSGCVGAQPRAGGGGWGATVAATANNAFSHLMSSARQMYTKPALTAPVPGEKTHSSSSSRSSSGYSWQATDRSPYGSNCPAYKKVGVVHPVTKRTSHIVVDGFQYANRALSDCYFLTHFHSDHTVGLTKEFNSGRIYCSPTTAALLRLKLKLKNGPDVNIIPLDLERTYTVHVGGCGAMYTDGSSVDSSATSALVPVEVVCADANHCPGAIVILFTFPNGRKVLHTGDFRWCPELLQSSPMYRSLKFTSPRAGANSGGQIARNLSVYLDTTYCDPSSAFPPQQKMLDLVVECVLADANAQLADGKDPHKNTLYVFGAYSIGKERVYMSAAQALGRKVYMDKLRWRMCLCYDEWGEREFGMLTTDDEETNVHVAYMNQVNFNHLSTLRTHRTGCTRVVAFSPTGWTFGGAAGGGRGPRQQGAAGKKRSASGAVVSNPSSSTIQQPFTLKARTNGTDLIYPVPYSEHSSFAELVSFMDTFRPNVIIPTVNTSIEAVKRQLQHLKDAGTANYGIDSAVSAGNEDVGQLSFGPPNGLF